MKFSIIILLLNFLLSASMVINASDYDHWVYINLSLGSEVDPISPEDNLGWDIACQRYHFRTNSGLSGNGNGGAYVDSINTWTTSLYNSVNEVPENSFFEKDDLVNTFYYVTPDTDGDGIEEHYYGAGIANPSLETWGIIDIDDNYTMNYTDNQFIVRSGMGDTFYKFWAIDYYSQNGTSGYITIFFDEVSPCTLGHDDCGECDGNNSTCSGCTDDTACNYDIMASINQGCEYPMEDYDCDGICIGIDCEDAVLGFDEKVSINKFSLSQNYPNPFNPSTLIEYSISEPSNILIDIFDLNGKNILTLDKGFKNAGSYVIFWDGNNSKGQKIPSGMYIYKLMLNGLEVDSRKMLLVY